MNTNTWTDNNDIRNSQKQKIKEIHVMHKRTSVLCVEYGVLYTPLSHYIPLLIFCNILLICNVKVWRSVVIFCWVCIVKLWRHICIFFFQKLLLHNWLKAQNVIRQHVLNIGITIRCWILFVCFGCILYYYYNGLKLLHIKNGNISQRTF